MFVQNASASSLGATKGRQWQIVCTRAPWSPRAGGVVEWYTGSFKVSATQTTPGPGFLLYGVGVWSTSADEDRTDVWFSKDKGKNWRPVYQDVPFDGLLSAITVQDSKGAPVSHPGHVQSAAQRRRLQ